MSIRFWLGFAAVAALALGSPALALVVHERERHSIERREEDAAARAARQAEALAFLAVGQLRATAAFLQVDDDGLSRHEFDVLSDALLSEGGLRAAAVAEADGGCCPVSLAASGAESVAAPAGLDLTDHPLHAAAIEAARDSGRTSITPIAPALVAPGRGLVAYQPVYRDGAPTATVRQRRRFLSAMAVGTFRPSDLATATRVVTPEGSTVQLLEEGEPVLGPQRRLEGASAPVRIADRTWMLVVSAPGQPGVVLSLLIGGVGLSLAALLGALVMSWSRRERMQELERQASQDPLTGLKNRRRFGEDLRAELARSRRDRSEGAVLMLDLDNFKQVNDTLGHTEGDRVIAEIAGVLRARMRATDVVARLGGDEFGLVLPRCDAAEAKAIATEIAGAIRDHISCDEAVPPITASVGVAMFGPDPRATMETLMVEADTAMYEAKRAGSGAVRMAGSRPGGALASGPNAAPDRLR